ncbi:MAG: hypothetical protein J6Y13_04045, partial [Treponema sp.]|nr:hypothetical protein [Treponema sp.]
MNAKLAPAVTSVLILLCSALFAAPAGKPADKAAAGKAAGTTPAKTAGKAEEPSCPVLDLSTIKPSRVTVLGGAALADAVRSESGF